MIRFFPSDVKECVDKLHLLIQDQIGGNDSSLSVIVDYLINEKCISSDEHELIQQQDYNY